MQGCGDQRTGMIYGIMSAPHPTPDGRFVMHLKESAGQRGDSG